jgi:kynurenine aminotransferase
MPTLAASARIVYCTNSPLQEAAAAGLEQAVERRFFETQLREYQERRDVFVSALDRLGATYTLPEGTYFVLVVCFKCPGCNHTLLTLFVQDSSNVKIPDDYPFPESVLGRGRDFRSVRGFALATAIQGVMLTYWAEHAGSSLWKSESHQSP